jgi:hypothetical protein
MIKYKIKKAILFVIIIFIVDTMFAQKNIPKAFNEYASIDKKALAIPDSLTGTTEKIAAYIDSSFDKQTEKARATFIWIATNIQYDIDNMYALNFYEKKEEKIAKPLKTGKGICENYAVLFTDICTKAGIKSFVVEGYTKQNGFSDYIPHAWCAALIDSSWFLFDPTWGSGYINNGRFYRKLNNDYFKTSPASLIKSHMPFDLLWQFLNYPVTNQEFYEGRVQQNETKPFFNFSDSIKEYEKENYIEQLIASSNRIERNGVKNSMIFDRLQHIKMEVENDRVLKISTLYNSAVSDYNEGINSYNEFIQYRNKQFKPLKTDLEIQKMIDESDRYFKSGRSKLNEIKNPDANIVTMMVQLTRSIDDASLQLKEQQDWLKKYFSKGKSERKSMFYTKIRW